MEGQNLQHLKYGTSSAESVTILFGLDQIKLELTLELYDNDMTRQITGKTYTISSAEHQEKKTLTFSW